ncbi:MAG TPA: DUF3854 domain-containing protein [Gemmataceae bacterium]|nr:DUF3854 domain-containing protein [Gemmataceae bacterium]
MSRGSPCPVCKEPDWCSITADGTLAKCMRVEAGSFKSKADKNGALYYLHRLTGAARADSPPPRPPGPGAARADADLLHRAYSALLAGLQLSKAHREAFRGRGLNDEEIDRRGYRTLPIRGRARLARDLRELQGDALLSVPGFILKPGDDAKPYLTIAGAAGLLVPVRDLAGRVVALLVRRDDAKDGGGKYSYLSSAKHGGPGPGAPPHVPLGIEAPAETVRLTEGALKGDVATALSGLPTVGAAGLVWRPALDVAAALGCETIRLAFDADALDNAHVARALSDCCEAARAAGLAVEMERWDKGDGKGIDDLLAAGKAPEVLTGEAALAAVREAVGAATAGDPPPAPDELDRLSAVLADGGAPALFADKKLLEALARLASTDPAAYAARRATLKRLVSLPDLEKALKPLLREQARERPPVLLTEAGYRIEDDRICRECGTHDGGTSLVPLSNFTARITEVVTRDDGAEQTALFTLAGALMDGRKLPPVQVTAADFAGLAWVTTAWHGEAVVYAGQGTRDHLRAALELLSPNRARRTVYLHTGWRKLGDGWHYLHAGGAIGTDGPAAGVEVSLPDPLAGFLLPTPPEGEPLAAAVRASLGLLDGLTADRLIIPLLAAVYRAALGEAPGPIDFALHLAGPHGAGKSELAALAQQHFGAALDARHLPGGWSSTANALEGLAFAAKDALLTVDDYAPRGAPGDRQRLERDADRLLRAQGNQAGRGRMRADGSLRPPKPPRGLILSTGEDVPPGQSLRGRMLVLEVSPDDVPKPRLTPHQRATASGLYAQGLSGFVRWLASQYGELCARLPGERAALRDRAQTGIGSARTPGIVADLALGLKVFLDFALATGAITQAEREALARRGWQALVEASGAHAKHVEAAEPTALFLRLLAAALASGRAHVAGPDGGKPENPRAWGWREAEFRTAAGSDSRWEPQGRRVGWLDGPEDLLLEPEAAYAETQELARHQGEALPVSSRTLWKRLRERSLLASWDERRQRNTIRRTLEGVKDRDVLHLRAGALSPCSEPSEPSVEAGKPPIPAEKRMVPADGPGSGNGHSAENRPQEPSGKPEEKLVCGRFGRSATGGDNSLRDEMAPNTHAAPVPPPGARLYYQDEAGRSCGPESAVRWCWEGAPAWIDANQYPPPLSAAPHRAAGRRTE